MHEWLRRQSIAGGVYPHKRSNKNALVTIYECIKLQPSGSGVFHQIAFDSGPVLKCQRQRKPWNYSMLNYHKPKLEFSPWTPHLLIAGVWLVLMRGWTMGSPRGKKIPLPGAIAQPIERQTISPEARQQRFPGSVSADCRRR